MGKKMMGVLVFFWRMLYPLFIYLIITSMVSIAMLSMGFDTWGADAVLLTGIGAGITAVLLGLLYRSVVDTDRHHSHWGGNACALVVLTGVGSSLFFNYLIGVSGLTSDAYEEVSALLYQPPLMLQILVIGIVVPVTEELVFRGMGYFRMRMWLSAGVAAVVSALYFGLFHGNIVQGVYALILGVLLAFVAEVYQTLWAPICFHGAANLSSIFLTSVLPEAISEQMTVQFLLFLIAGLMMFFGIYQIRKDRVNHEITVNSNPLL